MDVHFWKLKQQQREEDDDSPEHRGRSIGNAHRKAKCQIKHRRRCGKNLRAWLASLGWCATRHLREDHHRAQIYREFVDRVEGRGILVDPVLAEAHWHMEQVENHASYLRVTMEDVDTDEADFQQVLDESTDAKNHLVQHNGYLPRQWVFGSAPRVPVHVFDDNSDVPLLESEGWFRKQAPYRHKCRMAAIEVEANKKIRKRILRKVQTKERRLRAWRYSVLLASKSRSPSITRPPDGTCKIHWC